MNFLPTNIKEIKALGWRQPDIVLVTGDAYIDHPSFGISIIARWLEAHDFKVAILSQPRYDNEEEFKSIGPPRLFFGITAGNLDSIVANYTGNSRVREKDAYSPYGNPYFKGPKTRANRRRPDRATIRYANLAKMAYPSVPIVIGGIEASLRRFIHYDYQQECLRNSILTDSKADILVYGMGELAVLEIAKRLSEGKGLFGIPGTCIRVTEKQLKKLLNNEQLNKKHAFIALPSWNEISKNIAKFMDAEITIDQEARGKTDNLLIQEQKGGTFVLQFPQSRTLSRAELDSIYELPFTRLPHPKFKNVPAYQMIKDSITILRGCSGNCSFCAIARHQGAVIVSRSIESILKEIKSLVKGRDFKGTISDLGGPTANLYGATCKIGYDCPRKDCLYPRPCKNLVLNEKKHLELLKKVSSIPEVRHCFISSGLRMELLLETPALLKRIIEFHTPGMLKIAPEHTEEEVLKLMHKPSGVVLEKFLKMSREISSQMGKKLHISCYLMTSHPGCKLTHMKKMAEKLKKLRLPIRQFQDFTPTPGTISTAMYVTGIDPKKKKPIFVPRKRSERMEQRKILEKLIKNKR